MSEIEDDNGNLLGPGASLDTAKHTYILEEMLGEGGFGAVYRCHLSTDPSQKYAVKIERKLSRRRHSKLKMEIYILKLLTSEHGDKRHFTAIVDRAKKTSFFFLVMDLVGKSLEELIEETPSKRFSLGTAIGAGIQSLEGIQDLHSIGFLHRDLKPANLAIGRGNKSGIIYLIDFGIARKYVKDNEEMKAPRCQIGFKGTIRYASINCHHGHELGPKDDCESLMYVFFEFIHPKGLPWVRTFLCSHNIHFFPKHMNDRGEVVKLKEECRSKKRDKLIPQIGCREEFSLMLDYIDNRKYADKIDYKYLYDMFKLCAEIMKIDLNAPYDWQSSCSSSHQQPSSSGRNGA